jgi:hypothetical protein
MIKRHPSAVNFPFGKLRVITQCTSLTPSRTKAIQIQSCNFISPILFDIILSFSRDVGNTVPGSRFNFQIIIGAWLLAAMVLVNCYSGTVVSYLTAPRMIPSINNLEDLAASEDVGVLVLDNNVIGQQIMVIKIRYLVIVH